MDLIVLSYGKSRSTRLDEAMTTPRPDPPHPGHRRAGKTGRRVAGRLADRAGRPPRLALDAPPFDWYEPTTWRAALDGVAAGYVTFQPDLAVPGAVETIVAVRRRRPRPRRRPARAAVGPRRARGPALRAVAARLRRRHHGRALQLLRPELQRALPGGAVLDGVIALPAGDVLEPIVDADDIAEVAVERLAEPGTPVASTSSPGLGCCRSTTSPRAERATGRDRLLDVTPEEYVAAAARGRPRGGRDARRPVHPHLRRPQRVARRRRGPGARSTGPRLRGVRSGRCRCGAWTLPAGVGRR